MGNLQKNFSLILAGAAIILGGVGIAFGISSKLGIDEKAVAQAFGAVAPPKDDKTLEEMTPEEILSAFPFYRGYERLAGLIISANADDAVFGATPFRPSFFKTRLARSLAEATDNNIIYVTTITTADGGTVTTGTIGDFFSVIINPNSATGREIVSCTGTDSSLVALTGCSRGYRFYDNTTTTARMTPHAPGELIIISNDDLYQTTQYVNIDSPQTLTGRKTFATSSGIRIGDGGTSYDKFVYASNGDTDLPFLAYDEDGGSDATGCWAFSHNGVSSQCMTQASSTYSGTNGITIDASGGIGIRRTATTTSGLSFTGAGTSTMEVFVDGNFYRDVFAARINASSTYWEDAARSVLAYVDTSGNMAASGTLTLFSTVNTSTVNNIRPNTNNQSNLGFYDNAWRNLYASGTLFADSFTLAGSGTSSLGSIASVTSLFVAPRIQSAPTSTTATTTITGGIYVTGGVNGDGVNYLGASYAIGTFTRDLNAVDGAVTYTHNLGVLPKYIEIDCNGPTDGSGTLGGSHGRATGVSTESGVNYNYIATNQCSAVATNIIEIDDDTSCSGADETGNLSALTATTFDITWSTANNITETIACTYAVSR